jgi:hypothetical protein
VVLESSQPEVLDSLGSLLLGPVLLELGDLGGLVLVVLIVRVGSFAGGDLLGGGLDLAGDDLGSAGVEGSVLGGELQQDTPGKEVGGKGLRWEGRKGKIGGDAEGFETRKGGKRRTFFSRARISSWNSVSICSDRTR